MSNANGGSAKSLLKNTGIFAIGTFGSKVLVLLVIPLCTYYIDTASMGVYDMAYTVVSLLQPVAMLAVAEALFRWMLDEALDKRKVLSTWAALFIAFLIVFSAAYWVVWAFVRFDDALLMYLLVVSGCAYQSAQYGTRGLHANKLFAASGVVYSAVYCGMTFLLVVVWGVGYQGLLVAILVAAASTTVLLVAVQPELRCASMRLFDRPLAAEMARYSAFLLPNQLCWWALNWLSRLFIVGFLGFAANGVYSVAMKFPSALSMLSGVFFPAWQEQAIALYGKEGSCDYFSQVFKCYARLFLSALLPGVPLTVLFVHACMDSSYAQAADLVGILYLGACFSAFSSFYGVLYLCAKDTRGAASTTVMGAAVSIAASLALIPVAGVAGAAVANMAANLAMWIVRTRQTGRYCRIRAPWADVASLSAAAVAMSLACGAFAQAWQLLVAAVAGTVLMLAINRDSIRWIAGIVKKKVSR